MIRAIELVALGLTKREIYYRARKLGFDPPPGKPYRFTKAQVYKLLRYEAQGQGRPRKGGAA